MARGIDQLEAGGAAIAFGRANLAQVGFSFGRSRRATDKLGLTHEIRNIVFGENDGFIFTRLHLRT